MADGGPRVSVIVPAYGVAHLLDEALASLQAQWMEDWEAIVIDDGAPDDVAGVFSRFDDDPRMRLLLTDNGGLATARNRAIAEARAPLVALLDGDDAYEPGYLAAMVATMQTDPAIGFVTCDATYAGLADRAGQRFSSHNPQAGAITLDSVLDRRFNVFIGCTIRYAALAAVNGFDDELAAGEDLDLWIRLLAAGWQGKLVAEPLVRYRRRAGSLSSDASRMLRAIELVYVKAAAALANRPEQATARAVLTRIRAERDWGQGAALIEAGEIRAGLALLAGAQRRSLRWRLAMPVMRLFPGLARSILRLRSRLPEPKR